LIAGINTFLWLQHTFSLPQMESPPSIDGHLSARIYPSDIRRLWQSPEVQLDPVECVTAGKRDLGEFLKIEVQTVLGRRAVPGPMGERRQG
jgi:hypothetical protein